MDDIEMGLMEYEKMHRLEREYVLKNIADSIKGDYELIYTMLCDTIAKRYNVDNYAPVYELIKYYVNNVDMNLMDWLYSDNAPFLVPTHKIGDYFPEFKGIAESDYEIVKLANKVYGVDLLLDYDCCTGGYVYAYEFNFNSFTPIDIQRLKVLKQEKDFCLKYGVEPDFEVSDAEKRIMEVL